MTNSNTPKVVAHPKSGEVITMFEGKDKKNYGRVRVDSTQLTVNNNMTVVSRRTAFITLTEQALEILAENIKAGEAYPISGKLVVRETLTKSYETQEPKTRGEGGDVITHGGQPVYRETFFSTNLQENDVLLTSDSNVEVTENAPAETSNAPE